MVAQSGESIKAIFIPNWIESLSLCVFLMSRHQLEPIMTNSTRITQLEHCEQLHARRF